MKVAAQMRIQVLVILFAGASAQVIRAQDAPPTSLPATQSPPPAAAPASQGAPQPETETDRYPLLREAADTLRGNYEALDRRNMAEIDRLTRTRRCQINRIGPLLDRTIASMNEYLTAERKYWQVWNDAETKRVDSERATLAGMEAELERVARLQETEKQDHQDLQRRKAGLEQSKRTEEINALIDGLIKDIQDSEARLTDAQQQFDALKASITDMKAYLTARLIGIRQNLARLDAWEAKRTSVYEDARAAANQFCNTKRPDERATPLPRTPSN